MLGRGAYLYPLKPLDPGSVHLWAFCLIMSRLATNEAFPSIYLEFRVVEDGRWRVLRDAPIVVFLILEQPGMGLTISLFSPLSLTGSGSPLLEVLAQIDAASADMYGFLRNMVSSKVWS